MTDERLAELNLILSLIEDEEEDRRIRAIIDHETARRERARNRAPTDGEGNATRVVH